MVGCIEPGKKTSNQTDGFYEIDLSEFLISDQSTGEKRKYMVVLNRAFTCIKQLNELLGNGTVVYEIRCNIKLFGRYRTSL